MFMVTLNNRCGREAAILILELRLSVGSLTAARHNSLGGCLVPKAASYHTSFSVSFGESRRSDSVPQQRLCAQNGPPRHESGGNLRPGTDAHHFSEIPQSGHSVLVRFQFPSPRRSTKHPPICVRQSNIDRGLVSINCVHRKKSSRNVSLS
jgi:hypothetical protein